MRGRLGRDVVRATRVAHGLGWDGHLERWQSYLVVIPVWALILPWSKPWLERFEYNPLEWLVKVPRDGGQAAPA